MAIWVFTTGGAVSRSSWWTLTRAGIAAALCVATMTGCGGEPEGKTDLAKLPPPPPSAAGRTKAPSPAKPPPKYGSPPAKRGPEP